LYFMTFILREEVAREESVMPTQFDGARSACLQSHVSNMNHKA
jgi:hypothetical protein